MYAVAGAGAGRGAEEGATVMPGRGRCEGGRVEGSQGTAVGLGTRPG